MRYTIESRKQLLQLVTTDVVGILINAPVYGGTTPNQSQLQALDKIIMQDIVKYELTGQYKRFISTNLLEIEELEIGGNTFAIVEVPMSFNTPIVNATHICYVYGALIDGANDLNFNNRSNLQGTPFIIKPIADEPVSITPPAVIEYSFKISLGSI